MSHPLYMRRPVHGGKSQVVVDLNALADQIEGDFQVDNVCSLLQSRLGKMGCFCKAIMHAAT